MDFLKGKKTTIWNTLGAVIWFLPYVLPEPYATTSKAIIQSDWFAAIFFSGNLGLRQVTNSPESLLSKVI